MNLRNILVLMGLAGAVGAANAQAPDTLLLWPNGAPNAIECNYTPERMAKDNIVTEPILIVFPAAEPNGKAIIACPGGGYQHLAKYHEGTDMAQWFNDQGITYAVLLYRIPEQHHDIPLSDTQQALRLMRSKADKYGIKKVGIMGSSAGGHLASTTATHFVDADTRPDFQILFYPVISFDPAIAHAGTRQSLLGKKPDPAMNWLYSNETQVTPQTPPAFIMHSADDATVNPENSIRYFQALRAAGVPAQLNIYPMGGHGWGFRDQFPYKPAWTSALELWLENLE